jgi:hypothetical protein
MKDWSNADIFFISLTFFFFVSLSVVVLDPYPLSEIVVVRDQDPLEFETISLADPKLLSDPDLAPPPSAR